MDTAFSLWFLRRRESDPRLPLFPWPARRRTIRSLTAFSASEEKRMTPQPSGLPQASQPEAGDPGLTPALQVSQHIQREHLLTIFEHVPAGIVYLDPAGRILAV